MATESENSSGERIAKVIARAGLCSRRDAERWIADGRVMVNGKTIPSPALNVTSKDRINVDGKALTASEPTRLWRYYKPTGLVTTHKDPEGRSTVFENLPDHLPRVISVGRLDLNSEGLLLLTNDGELARKLELPSQGWLRRYRVRVHGNVSEKALEGLKKGVRIDGVSYGAIEATLDRVQGRNAWLTVSLREGKNREVRKVLQHLDLHVTRLIRTVYGPFQVKGLEPGDVVQVKEAMLAQEFGEAEAVPKKPLQANRKKHRNANRRRHT